MHGALNRMKGISKTHFSGSERFRAVPGTDAQNADSGSHSYPPPLGGVFWEPIASGVCFHIHWRDLSGTAKTKGEEMKRTKSAKLLHTLIDQDLDTGECSSRELSRTELHQQVDLLTPDPKATTRGRCLGLVLKCATR